jgi:hypothetical protein
MTDKEIDLLLEKVILPLYFEHIYIIFEDEFLYSKEHKFWTRNYSRRFAFSKSPRDVISKVYFSDKEKDSTFHTRVVRGESIEIDGTELQERVYDKGPPEQKREFLKIFV